MLVAFSRFRQNNPPKNKGDLAGATTPSQIASFKVAKAAEVNRAR